MKLTIVFLLVTLACVYMLEELNRPSEFEWIKPRYEVMHGKYGRLYYPSHEGP